MTLRPLHTVLATTIVLGIAASTAGCATGGDVTAGSDGPTSTHTGGSARTASPTPTAAADLLFEGQQPTAAAQPVWSVELSALQGAGWSLDGDGTNPADGVWTYRNTDGGVAVVRQQQVADADPTEADKAATVRVLSDSGYSGDLHEQRLPRTGGGEVAFVSAATTTKAGQPAVVVARVFAKPRIVLSILLSSTDSQHLHDDITVFADHASVLLD